MKKSELRRYTALTAKTGLRRTALGRSPLARSTLHAGSAARKTAPKRSDTGPSAKVRALVHTRSGGWCEWAGCWLVASQIHHRRPRRMGGSKDPASNWASNLLDLCSADHEYAESNRAEALDRGVLLHASADPRAVPVLSRHGLVWLADDGAVLTTNPYAEEATMTNYVQRITADLCDRLPDCPMDLIDLYTLLTLTRGRETTLEDVHDAWAIYRNASKPEHPSLVPFDLLTPEVQELDRKYMDAIHEAATAVAS